MTRNKKIIEVNELSESTKASLRTRVISAIVAAAIVAPAFILGDWFFFALIVVAVGVATYEIIRCAKPRHSIWLTIVSLILALLLACWPMLRQVFNSAIEKTGWKLWCSFETLYLSILFTGSSLSIFPLSYQYFLVAPPGFEPRLTDLESVALTITL